ncbi:MAG: hypothetical protein HZT40_18995 [Candidatus Thiothrix singaporensis]|uniref:Uncharacterized protein n=1 Tax=Candidatus Thiothrix singaporensis TaxID=2799669 RepID=A0A7L6AW51_9GAMM|nr:MAG: hypothetical protein HZT40_18995 [Candidatus Thiothrix singaporensis]
MPQTISVSADNRTAVKSRIQELNRLAQDADTQMRNALTARNQEAATQWRQRRDAYNAEVKKLTDWLNNPTGRCPTGQRQRPKRHRRRADGSGSATSGQTAL